MRLELTSPLSVYKLHQEPWAGLNVRGSNAYFVLVDFQCLVLFCINMSSHAALSSDASRSKSGILTPTSGASLNSGDKTYHGDGAGYLGSRKRASGSSSGHMEDLLNPTIVVKVRMLGDLWSNFEPSSNHS